MKLTESFFARDTRQIARELLGMYLVRNIDDEILKSRIASTEAYVGMEKRDKKGILYPPGIIYMYPLRGHWTLNISTEKEGIPACVLIAEVEMKGRKYGQIKLTDVLKIDKSFDGKSIESDKLWIDYRIVVEERPNIRNCVGRYRLA